MTGKCSEEELDALSATLPFHTPTSPPESWLPRTRPQTPRVSQATDSPSKPQLSHHAPSPLCSRRTASSERHLRLIAKHCIKKLIKFVPSFPSVGPPAACALARSEIPTKHLAMRHTLYCAIMAMALVPTGLTTNVESVSLSKFVPRIDFLPQTCEVAYNTPIQGCTRADFPKDRNESINNCSDDCVQGLIKIVQLVNQQCSTVKVPADSIIGVALAGNLLPKLCGNIKVVTTGQQTSTQGSLPTSSTSTEASTTQQAQSSSAQASDSAQSTPSSTVPSSTAISSAASSPDQSTSLPPSTTQQGITIDTGTPPPAPSQTAIGQKSNPDSGGGSPFDVTLSSSSSFSRVQLGGLTTVAIVSVIARLVFCL